MKGVDFLLAHVGRKSRKKLSVGSISFRHSLGVGLGPKFARKLKEMFAKNKIMFELLKVLLFDEGVKVCRFVFECIKMTF